MQNLRQIQRFVRAIYTKLVLAYVSTSMISRHTRFTTTILTPAHGIIVWNLTPGQSGPIPTAPTVALSPTSAAFTFVPPTHDWGMFAYQEPTVTITAEQRRNIPKVWAWVWEEK